MLSAAAPTLDVCSPFRITAEAERPFRYFLADGFFKLGIEAQLLEWFETRAPWQLVITDFYEQHEFSMAHAELPEHLEFLCSDSALANVRSAMEQAFDVKLAPVVSFVAHKLVPGQRIAIHNDYLVGGETHRLTVQLNRGLKDEDGGFFMLFNSFDAADIDCVLRPVSGTCIGFEIGRESHHAVSRVHGGQRYTLVYSFRAEPR